MNKTNKSIGISAVDRAEEEEDKAMLINAAAPSTMAEWARDAHAVLIHYSTDYVFDGRKGAPYVESAAPNPLNIYGKSKLAAEEEVRKHRSSEWVIVRPPAVYGPRDDGFFSLFQAVQRHLLPLPSETQELSLVYVKDLARAVAALIDRREAGGQTYFVSGSEVVTAWQMSREIARQVGHWTVPFPLPPAAFLPLCLMNEIICRLFCRAQLLNLQKYAELSAC